MHLGRPILDRSYCTGPLQVPPLPSPKYRTAEVTDPISSTLTFPYLNKALGSYGTFWLYGIVCVLGYIFVFKYLPETKGKTLEEIERELVD